MRAGSVLVSAAVGEPFWILPGGHVDPGESPRQALCREWFEELGIPIQNPDPVAVLHTQWRRGGLLQGDLVHETLHLFRVHDQSLLPEGVFEGPEPALRFRWVSLDRLITEHVLPLEAIPWIVATAGGVYGGR